MTITPGDMRKLLIAVLPTDSDLHAFCLDGQLRAGRRMAAGMDRVAKINLLLELHEPDELLTLLRQHEPVRTERALVNLGTAANAPALPSSTPPSTAAPLRRPTDSARRVTIRLELYEKRWLRASYHVPDYSPLAEAPPVDHITIEAASPELRYGDQRGLAAVGSLLDAGSEADLQHWLTGAEVTKEGGLGQLLYRTLFPDEATEQRVLSYLLDGQPRPGVPISPIRQGVQVRVCTSSPELLGLPWRLTCWKGNLLADNGWTFAMTPELDAKGSVQLSAFSRILVLAPKVVSLPELNTTAHVEELRTQLAARIPEQGEDEWFRVVHSRTELDRALRAMPYDVLYYYGHGSITDGQVCLLLDDENYPQARLTIADLRQLLGQTPPKLALLNGCFSGAAGWQGAGHLLSPRVPVVVCSLTTAFTRYAGAFAINWLNGCLIDRSDPIELLHRRDPVDPAQTQHDFQWATYAVFANYTSWEPTPILARRRDPRNPHRLDRTAARAQVVEQVSALRDGRRRRVEALVAYAHDRSLIERFSWQATDHLERRGIAPVITISLQFPHERTDLYARLREDFQRQVAHPREPLGHALRRHTPKVRSMGKPVLWVNWGVCGDGAPQSKLNLQQLRCWLRWCCEFLCQEQLCPEDLRIVSFLALRVEPSSHEVLRRKMEEYKLEFNGDRFRTFLLPGLPKVEMGELKDYLSDPDLSNCADNAHTVMTATDLIYRDTDGHYEPVVAHIEWAEKHGWQSLIESLKRKHGPRSQPDGPEDI